ncbi:OadG family protein [Lachnospiraceae bacterium C1.1]|nr:OadG family protein [Lachnospiraceae bacterium C1.1]
MTNFKKKLALVSCSFALILSLTACGGASKDIKYDETSANNRAQSVISVFKTVESTGADYGYSSDVILDYDENQIEQFAENQLGGVIDGSAFQSGLESYEDAVEALGGEFKEVAETGKVSSDDESIIVDVDIIGANGKTATMEIMMDSIYRVTDIVFNVDKTFGEKIENAALNTVLGMGTTFVVLILIACLISLFPFIVAPFNGTKKKAAEAPAPAAKPEPAPAAAAPVVAETDDKELIAVIAAAIAAYESESTGVAVSPDTFVVRSIRRR